MYETPSQDLEAHYQESCARDNRINDIKGNVKQAIWEELADDLEADKFIYSQVADPSAVLAKVVHRLAEAKETEAKTTGATSYLRREARQAIRIKAFSTILSDIDELVEAAAEEKAKFIERTE